jgi:hypothetical protein
MLRNSVTKLNLDVDDAPRNGRQNLYRPSRVRFYHSRQFQRSQNLFCRDSLNHQLVPQWRGLRNRDPSSFADETLRSLSTIGAERCFNSSRLNNSCRVYTRLNLGPPGASCPNRQQKSDFQSDEQLPLDRRPWTWTWSSWRTRIRPEARAGFGGVEKRWHRLT